ncbi:MAG: cobalamin biosynthesis protein [Candidatus Methylomirabilia bacterium]
MRRIAVITLSPQGLAVAKLIKRGLRKADLYAHAAVPGAGRGVTKFDRVVALTEQIFGRYDGLVYVAPCGVVVRAIKGCVTSKLGDPAVVVLDVGARFAVSLVGGHEAGANALALKIANITGAEPVISTTTEAAKDIIVGVGCRKGIAAGRIEAAVRAALLAAGAQLAAVRFIASADVKAREPGLIAAAASLGVPLRIIASEMIRTFAGAFASSAFVMEKVNVPAVAEPAALLAGRRTSLLLAKRKFDGVTVAVARESFLS